MILSQFVQVIANTILVCVWWLSMCTFRQVDGYDRGLEKEFLLNFALDRVQNRVSE